jgi:L-fuconolactonase
LPDGELTQRALVIMDVVGVDRVLIVETGTTPPTPEEVSPTGHVRRRFNLSQHAVAAAPHRFAWVGRVDYDDPEVEDQVARLRSAGAIALRVVPLPETPAMAAFERGEHSRLLAAAQRYRLPVFVWLAGRTQLLPRYLRDFPELPFILDHAGTFFEPLPDAAARFRELAAVAELAALPNLTVKWCHAPERVSAEEYPYRDLRPYARRLIDAFSPQRVMWASDYIPRRYAVSWAQSLRHMIAWQEQEVLRYSGDSKASSFETGRGRVRTS